MVKCSKCGSEVTNPIKTWTVTLGKTKKVRITFGTFTCEKCNRKFKASIKREDVSLEQKTSKILPVYLRMVV